MTIPASKIVAVHPRLIKAGGTDLQIAGLLLTENEMVPFPSVLSFDGKEAVKRYFGAESMEYKLASRYFLGYDNSFAKPLVLYFGKRVKKAIGGFLQGAAISVALKDLKAVTSGSFGIMIDGNAVSVTGVNLSSVNSFSDVAALLQTALAAKASGVKVSYSSQTGGFVVTSGTTGDNSSVGYADNGDLADLLRLTKEDGGVISMGSAALSAAANMESIIQQTQNFVTFSTVYEANDDEALGLAKWVDEQVGEYLYCLWSEDEKLISMVDTGSIAKKLEEANVGGVTGIYGGPEYAVFVMATAASIDWNRRNGSINFAFKSQDGLAATVTDGNTADVLNKKRFNFYGRYATRNDSFIFLYNGNMFGNWGFIDPYVNGIWLRNVIQVALMNGLSQSPRTPYTEAGYTLIRAWMADPIERALMNGVIEPGVSLSQSQKAELFQEAGIDIASDIFTDGYYLQVLDPTAVARVNRESPVINLWYTYGGSINKLVVPVSAIV